MATQLDKIINPAVPNLPLGTETYERRYQDQFTNVLRLYFNQLRNALGELFGSNGGKYIEFPHIAASDGVIQYATAANTPTMLLSMSNTSMGTSSCSSSALKASTAFGST